MFLLGSWRNIWMGEAGRGVCTFQNRFDLKSKFSCLHFITTVHSYFFFSWLICDNFCTEILFFPSCWLQAVVFLMNDMLVMQTCLSYTPSRTQDRMPGLASSCTLITNNVWEEDVIRCKQALIISLMYPLWQYSETECDAITRLVF